MRAKGAWCGVVVERTLLSHRGLGTVCGTMPQGARHFARHTLQNTDAEKHDDVYTSTLLAPCVTDSAEV